MELYEYFGFGIVFIFGLLAAATLFSKQFAASMRQTIFLGYLLHAVGSLVRYAVLYGVYDGGDAGRYYLLGLNCANSIWNFTFTFLQKRYWSYGNLSGTQFTIFVSGFVLSIVGPSKRAEFLFFGILAYAGLLLMCKSFEKNFPQSPVVKYGRWVLFWPSLCFWPSSVGKDALILFATGLLVYGYSSFRTRIRWIPLLLGIILASLVRAHVAGVMVVAVAIAHWMAPVKKMTKGHYVQGILVLILLFVVLQQSFARLGIQDVDLDNLRGYVGTISTRTDQGGSAIGTPTVGITGIPLAVVNMLFRPFPWEAGSPFSMAASLEMVVFWTVFFKRRRRILELAREWRATRLMRLALPLTILYVLMLGMAVGNLGIIARQRIHIMPLLLLWLEARVGTPRKAADDRPGMLHPRSTNTLPVHAKTV